LAESIIMPGIKYDQDRELLKSDQDSRTQEFIFKDKKLYNASISQNLILYDNNTLDQLKSASLKLDVDVSNLREDLNRKDSDASTADLSERSSDVSSELNDLDVQGFLPRVGCEPRRVTISFNSDDGLTFSIVPQVLNPLVRHTDFKGQMTSKNQLKRLAFEAVPSIAMVSSKDKNRVEENYVDSSNLVKNKKSISR